MPLSLTLTLPGGTISAQSKTSWLHYLAHFSMKFNEAMESVAVLLTSSKNINVGLHSNLHKSIWLKLDMMIDTIEPYIFMLVYLTLTFIQGHKNARKQKFCNNYLTKFQSIWMEIGILFGFVSVMNLILILAHLSNNQEREPYLCDFVKKSVGLYSNIY